MLRDLCIPLTMKIMALDLSLYDAECLAALIVIECLLVYTIMGYRFPDEEPGEDLCFPCAPCGILPGTNDIAGCAKFEGEARNRASALLLLPS